ncbi:MAG: HIT domain-containing protein [candidate division NC10 bacterium]|nr:HIT domain-containing protein [candidate division NC10 bacterium]
MLTLWAPWRMEYIAGDKSSGCILCEKPKEGRDSENFILFRGEAVFIIMNIFPYNSGHLLIAPYRHIDTLALLTKEEAAELMAFAQKSEKVLKETLKAEGFNLGINLGKAAGAGIEGHIHLHVVPRWNGDTNFMPILGETKVIPEYLSSIYLKLLTHYQGR